MRFASFIRPLTRSPTPPTAMLVASDVARALSQALANQAAALLPSFAALNSALSSVLPA